MRVQERVLREFGVYLVTGNREYRGHEKGTEFVALIDRNAERRAVARRELVLLRRIVPAIEPEHLTFPEGWLDSPPQPVHEGAGRRPLH